MEDYYESVPSDGVKSDVWGVLTGGLQKALDLELYKGYRDIDQKAVAQENQQYIKPTGGVLQPAGKALGGIAQSPVLLIVVGVVALGAVVYLLKKA